jgi:hypothetical protein
VNVADLNRSALLKEGKNQKDATGRCLDEEAVSVILDCISKARALEIQQVSLLDFDHCQWVFEGGMPVDCGLAQPVLLFTDGSWCYPSSSEVEHSGRDFRSLMEFVQQQAAM